MAKYRTQVNIGEKHGLLTVVEEVEPFRTGNIRIRVFRLKCECGNTTEARMANVRSGAVSSCGCARKKYKNGEHQSPTYVSWDAMKQRCLNPNNPFYHNYGGRGITVCDSWLKFRPFLSDMGLRPSLDYSIDRYPNNYGAYEPGNCRWATRKQQNRNRRGNVMLEFNGEASSLTEWAERAGMSLSTLRCRVGCGWTVAEALTTPIRSWKGREGRELNVLTRKD